MNHNYFPIYWAQRVYECIHQQTAIGPSQTSINAQLFRIIEFSLSIDFHMISIVYQLAFGAFEQLLTTYMMIEKKLVLH